MGLLVADRVYNLLESFENWTEFLDEGHGVSPCVHLRRHAGVGEFGEFGVDIIYLDYRKAFDTVPHKRLLTKISQAGIGGKVLNWIRVFFN